MVSCGKFVTRDSFSPMKYFVLHRPKHSERTQKKFLKKPKRKFLNIFLAIHHFDLRFLVQMQLDFPPPPSATPSSAKQSTTTPGTEERKRRRSVTFNCLCVFSNLTSLLKRLRNSSHKHRTQGPEAGGGLLAHDLGMVSSPRVHNPLTT